jgi:hypothetical protein
MSVSATFQQYVQVSATLQEYFPDAPAGAQETLSQYNSSHDVPDLQWLEQHLPPLAEVLLPASFRVKLKSDVSGYKVSSTFQRATSGDLLLSEHEVDDSALSTASMSPPAQQALNDFKNVFGETPVDLNTMIHQATTLTAGGVPMSLTLDLYLDKTGLNQRFAAAGPSELTAKIVSFLLQDQLISKLANTTIDEFETEFLIAGRPTVFLVFDLNGGLASDFIAVCGREQHDQVEASLTRVLKNESLIRAERVHEFRQFQSFGNFEPKWLMPETLALTVTRGDPQLKRALQRFEPTLAAIFMADSVETDDDGTYTVEYRGLRPRQFQLDTAQIMAQEQHWDQLYELYQYAYDGLSGDKLEIVQQLVSQLAEDVQNLFPRAIEVREAAKKTHDRALSVKVQEYFAARQSVEERIQNAISELASDMITLSREVSADVYKVMGIIALAIAGSFFKADITLFALFLGFLTIAIYLLIVVLYHLPTLQLASKLRKTQQDAYINSFDDVLTADEIQRFLNDENWREARNVFANKRWWTKAIYVAFCVIAFAAAAGIVMSMWRATPAIPPVKTAVVAPESCYPLSHLK